MPTAAQSLRLKGFNASLSKRGVSLLLQPTSTAFTGLVDPVAPSPLAHTPSNDERRMVKISILIADVVASGKTIGVGDDFFNAASTKVYRVVKAPESNSLKYVYRCEESDKL